MNICGAELTLRVDKTLKDISHEKLILHGFHSINILDLSNLGLTSIDGIENLEVEIRYPNHASLYPQESGSIVVLKDVPNLQLTLSGNQLVSLPEAVGTLQLQQLYLSGNHFEAIPECIRSLTSLERLELSKNHLTNVPAWIGELVNLTQLFLEYNRIAQLPTEIGLLHKLSYLYIKKFSSNCLIQLSC